MGPVFPDPEYRRPGNAFAAGCLWVPPCAFGIYRGQKGKIPESGGAPTGELSKRTEKPEGGSAGDSTGSPAENQTRDTAGTPIHGKTKVAHWKKQLRAGVLAEAGVKDPLDARRAWTQRLLARLFWLFFKKTQTLFGILPPTKKQSLLHLSRCRRLCSFLDFCSGLKIIRSFLLLKKRSREKKRPRSRRRK